MRILIPRGCGQHLSRGPAGGPLAAGKRPSLAVAMASALTILATIALYLWVGQSNGGGWPQLRPPGEHETDHFNILSHGFLKGHLYVDLAVPPAIVNAPNPYDPALRQITSVLHDASYFKGHYYLYFGPAPVLTLFAPFALITGRDLPLPCAVWFFSVVGYLALVGIFFFGQRRHFPAASALAIVAALIALGTGNMLLTLLRRSNIWELSLAAGFCYFTISLFCLVRALASPRATAWAAAGALALGLAIASRPTYLLGCALFALPLWFRKRNPQVATHYGWPALFVAGSICAMIGLALAAYNYGRFGHPLEFGMTYQLSSTGEIHNTHFSPTYVSFNFRMYFTSALNWVATFPFNTGALPPPRPVGQAGVEYTFGLFRNLPFAWFGVPALASLLGWRAQRTGHDQAAATIGLIAASAVLNTITPLLFFGSCVRYLVDFAPSFMLLAAFGFLTWETWLNSAGSRQLLRITGLLAALVTAVVALLTIVHFYGEATSSPPATFRPLARALDWPCFQLRSRAAPDYSPVELVFSLPADRSPRQEPLLAVTPASTAAALVFIEYLNDDSIRFGYREHGHAPPTRFSLAIRAKPGARHTLRLSIGGTYADFDGAKASLRAECDDLRLWNERVVSIDVFPGVVMLGQDPRASSDAPRFTGTIHTHRPIASSAIQGTPPVGVRVNFTLQPAMAGRAFPILVSGSSGHGDILFLTVHSDASLTFGYDHWGSPAINSSRVAARFGDPQVLECWIPANPAPGAEPLLIARLNGRTIWHRSAPYHLAPPETITAGINLIGGTTGEAHFPNAHFAALTDPPPPPPPIAVP
ncbi:MAG: hypothetical protein RL077_1529 [Verrucomicrobiota bacterium]